MSAIVGEHFFWITSRAAGIAALLASSAAVALGLWMSGRKRKGADLRVAHEALSLATIAALVVHALALLGDGYLKPSLADLTIPLVSAYERLWMSVGIVAGWMLIILGLSYYVRGRIGPARWRKLHRFTALAWVLGIAHTLGEGTDASALWFLAAAAMTAIPAAVLLIRRLLPAPPVPA
jgi:methionine sulfoxide reductase heme-binding subunit